MVKTKLIYTTDDSDKAHLVKENYDQVYLENDNWTVKFTPFFI